MIEVESFMNPSNITFIIGLMGVIFGVYIYFRDPQIKSDKADALFAQKMNWMTEGTERRFKDIQDNFNGLLLQSNNHIHTVDVKVDKIVENMVIMSNEITKLATIIEERIPRKQNNG